MNRIRRNIGENDPYLAKKAAKKANPRQAGDSDKAVQKSAKREKREAPSGKTPKKKKGKR